MIIITKKYEYVLQKNNYDCGIACLQTIFLLHNKRLNRNNLSHLINKENFGVSMYDLIKESKNNNLEALGVSTKLHNLKDNLPCIAHTIKDNSFYHFIVILEITKNYILIMDPNYGIKKIKIDEYNNITTNKYIIFEEKKFIKTKDVRLKKIIISIFHQNKKLIFKSIVLSLGYSFLSLTFNYFLTILLNIFNHNNSLIYTILIIFTNILFLKTFINFLKNNILININYNIDDEITKKVINHIIHLPYDYFIETTSGEIATIIADIDNFKEIISKIFILTILDLIFILFISIYISFINIIFLLLVIILSILLFFITLNYQNILNNNYQKLKESKIKTSSYTYEVFTAFNTVKNLKLENKIIDKLIKLNKKTLKNNKNYMKKYFTFQLINDFLIDLFYLITIVICFLIIKNNNGALTNIVLLSNIFYLLIGLITNIYENISLKKVYETSINNVLEVLELKCEINYENNFEQIEKISFDNVGYIKNEQVILNNINFQINKKDKVFIKGASGIGKSTLIRLLLKNNNPTSGKITIDGINIKDLSPSFIRENITYVSQNETLFATTIKENMKLITPLEEKIKLACDTTLLEETLKTKDYLNIILEENASNLSGGQRKKIIIARALLKAKQFLILDESFNEISIEEEKKILHNIYNNYPELSVILISHRQNSINLFNKIYEIKRSDIV